jgi:tRNA1Val (adenine37-N6)-methyltransferase
MSNPWFQFKQFTVWHDKCAMKVGTDGVLLGAWAELKEASTLLDIGTGSGLIALMMAQRYPDVTITAIDIDETATLQAAENFAQSPWNNRLTALPCSLGQFAEETLQRFDAIISNPPYFQKSLHSPDQQRTVARHTALLDSESLLKYAKALLTDQGFIHFIFPVIEGESVVNLATKYGLYCCRKTYVYSNPDSLPKRLLITLKKSAGTIQQETLTIETGVRHCYTDEYVQLTRAFYLQM